MTDHPGGRILKEFLGKISPSRFLLLALVAGVCGLAISGIDSLAPDRSVTLPQDGSGGPAEILTADQLPPEPLAADFCGILVAAPENSFLFRDRLGPLEVPAGENLMILGAKETFYDALLARGAPHGDIMTLVKACKSFRDLRKVRPGETFRIVQDPDGGLRSLAFDLDLESYVTWVRAGDTYERRDGTYPVVHRMRGVAGEIHSSLYASLDDVDAPLALAAKLNDILGWNIDFKRDLRRGDTFEILFDEVWKDGERVRTGAIEAVKIVNRGRAHRAFFFEGPDGKPGYFDQDGHNLQKQLLRAPLQYSRISDSFTYRRYHPVLKRWMPHLGVDYAAPLGTPVRAGGDGVVVEATSKKGNGRYIRMRHNNSEYETYYLHLSRFAKGLRKGSHVRQGDVIGFVGATGYATGPHLDYRVKRSGKFVNPRTLKLPPAAPVSGDIMDTFAAHCRRLTTALASLAPGEARDLDLASLPLSDAPLLASSPLPVGVRATP